MKWFDRVVETSTTTGTGTFTLAGAVTGFQAWSVVGNANTAHYVIEAIDAGGVPTGDWETGIGTYTSSGTTLARTTVLASSNGGSLVNFGAGTKRVILTLPASPTDGGLAKGWVQFNGTGTIAANDSFNVASLTDNGTGDYTVNWSAPFANGNYAVGSIIKFSDSYSAASNYTAEVAAVASNPATGSCRVRCAGYTNVLTDLVQIHLIAHGDQ